MPQGHDKGGTTENFQRPEGPKMCSSTEKGLEWKEG